MSLSFAQALEPLRAAPSDLVAEDVRSAQACVLVDRARPGEPLVISFGFADWANVPRFDFFRRLKALETRRGKPFNRILVRDPANAWYQRGVPGLGEDPASMAEALTRCIETLRPSAVVTLGQSAGAYAAVLFAHLLKADRAVAFGSLSLLDPVRAAAIGDRRWLSVMQGLLDETPPGAVLDLAAWCGQQAQHPALRLHAGLVPDAETPAAAVNLDVWHAQRFAGLPGARLQVHAHAGHLVVQHLAEREELDALLDRDLFEGLAPDASATPAVLSPAPPPRTALDAGWRQWMAENRLRGCDPASMLAGMEAQGVDPAMARQALREIEVDPGYLAGRKVLQLHDKLASVMGNLQRLWSSSPDDGHVERRSRVSRDEFLGRYVRGCRPLILTDLARDWPALRRWSPADLKARFGHAEVEIQSGRLSDSHYEINKLALRRRVRLGDFIDRVASGESSNDDYLTANNELLLQPEFATLLDDIGSQPDYCRREDLAGACWLWLGPAGTVTPLHHDPLMLMHTQIVGRKRWRFISPLETPRLYNHVGVFSPIDLDRPDWSRYPRFKGVQVLEALVEPGDTVFLPLGWWHQVTSLDPSVSFSFTNLDVPNDFSFADPDIRNW